MPEKKEHLLNRIDFLREAQTESSTPHSATKQLAERRLILDVLEYLLLAHTARNQMELPQDMTYEKFVADFGERPKDIIFAMGQKLKQHDLLKAIKLLLDIKEECDKDGEG